MRSTNAERLLETLTRFLGAEASGFAVVGYSGGRDSGVLLWSLAQVLGPGAVTAVHVDHGWRPPEERRAERDLVHAFCKSLGVSLVEMGPPEVVERTESAARVHRFRCFQEYLGSRPDSLLYLAHHADDQAETILMRLLKGRSWQGLAGMPARRGAYRRPFLEVPAEVLVRTAEELSLPFHHDTSNDDLTLARNFLRRRVLPRLKTRFPRVVGALTDFGQVWGQAALLQEPHQAWERVGLGYRIDGALWATWSSLQRQAQLLCLVNLSDPNYRPARRFLETVADQDSGNRVQGGGWRWSWGIGFVHWCPVAPPVGKEYFIDVELDRWYDLGWYQFQWNRDALGLLVTGVDPGRPWVWRSPVPGMRYASSDDPDWGKALKRKRFGTCAPATAVLVVQEGLIRAIVDPRENRLLWSESGVEKLHKPGIFVTLVTVTPNSTE